jgi:hypothetical protein
MTMRSCLLNMLVVTIFVQIVHCLSTIDIIANESLWQHEYVNVEFNCHIEPYRLVAWRVQLHSNNIYRYLNKRD